MMPSTAPAPGIFHDTAFGDVARFLSRGRLFPQPEDDPSFDVDAVCTSLEEGQTQHSSAAEEEKHADGEKGAGPRLASEPNPEVAPAPATPTHNVTWYGDDDVANPLNWSFTYKVFITFTICIMTTSIYMGSSIFAPAIPVFAEDRGTTPTVATLSISLFVWGYGMGPLLLSPITEVSFIGRNWPYIISIGIFVLLQIPTVLTDSVAGFLVLRFLSGFAGSPVLATGGATIGDIWGYGGGFANALGCWGYASAAGPVVGPIVGGFAVDANGWRWAIWPLFWASAGTWLWIFFLLPETSGATILSRRAARLRQRTGNSELVSEGDVHDRSLHASTLALNTLVRPFELMILEPVVLFNNLYIALVYGKSHLNIVPAEAVIRTGLTLNGLDRYFVWLLRGLPHRLSGAPRLQCRPHGRFVPRHPHRRRLDPARLLRLEQSLRLAQVRFGHVEARVPTAPSHVGRRGPTRLFILVRLDFLPFGPLDFSYPRLVPLCALHLPPLPGHPQLPRGDVSALDGIRLCQQRRHARSRGWCVPPLLHYDV